MAFFVDLDSCSIPSWSFQPCKRSFPANHKFYEDGNLFCNILLKQTFVPDDEFNSNSEEIQCDFGGCSKHFLTIQSYEAHYNSFHRHACQQCHRTFPSNFLLDLHILENHDILFKMMSHTKLTFRCILESCPDKFSSDAERRDHLVVVHKYPADFRFNRPSRKQRKLSKAALESMDTSDHEEMDTAEKAQGVQKKTENKMDVTEPCSNTRRIPKNICFGRGSTAAFHNKRNARTFRK